MDLRYGLRFHVAFTIQTFLALEVDSEMFLHDRQIIQLPNRNSRVWLQATLLTFVDCLPVFRGFREPGFRDPDLFDRARRPAHGLKVEPYTGRTEAQACRATATAAAGVGVGLLQNFALFEGLSRLEKSSGPESWQSVLFPAKCVGLLCLGRQVLLAAAEVRGASAQRRQLPRAGTSDLMTLATLFIFVSEASLETAINIILY